MCWFAWASAAKQICARRFAGQIRTHRSPFLKTDLKWSESLRRLYWDGNGKIYILDLAASLYVLVIPVGHVDKIVGMFGCFGSRHFLRGILWFVCVRRGEFLGGFAWGFRLSVCFCVLKGDCEESFTFLVKSACGCWA